MHYSQRLSGCPQGERKNPAGELSKNQKSERCEKLLYFDGVGADKKNFFAIHDYAINNNLLEKDKTLH